MLSMPKKKNTNLDIIKRDAAERRKEDIEKHGKPTAFRSTMTKNKKAYTRKQKHKIELDEDDISEMVEESLRRLFGREDNGLKEFLSLVDRDFDSDVNEVMSEINKFLAPLGISAKYNTRYDFSGYYADCVAVYQARSVKRNGCMRMAINKKAIMDWVKKEYDDFFRYKYVYEQIAISLWHECAHGLVEWIKQKRRLDTQQGTGIFRGEKLMALRNLLNTDEEQVTERFAEVMAFNDGSSELLSFINKYMKEKKEGV